MEAGCSQPRVLEHFWKPIPRITLRQNQSSRQIPRQYETADTYRIFKPGPSSLALRRKRIFQKWLASADLFILRQSFEG